MLLERGGGMQNMYRYLFSRSGGCPVKKKIALPARMVRVRISAPRRAAGKQAPAAAMNVRCIMRSIAIGVVPRNYLRADEIQNTE